MKKKELRKELMGLSKDELSARAKELAGQIMKLNFKRSTRQLEKSHELQSAKRNLARVKMYSALRNSGNKSEVV